MTPPQAPHNAQAPDDPEPRWPALVAALAATGLYAALPESLAVGPRWLLGTVIAILAAATILTRRRGYHLTNILIGHVLSGTLTVFMLLSLVLLLKALPAPQALPLALLRSPAVL